MNKFMLYAQAAMCLLAGFSFASCSDNDEDTPKNYNLTVTVQAPEEIEESNILNLQMVAKPLTGKAQTAEVAIGENQAISLRQGVYTLMISGKIADEATAYVSGTAVVELYGDRKVTVKLDKINKSTLIFKEIFTTGGKQGYMKDSYFEIVNNSDEVQYLDGVIISSTQGGQKTENAWQANGFENIYAQAQGAVVQFPGSGTEYPLLPGQSVVVANDAANHAELAGEGNNCADLSKAEWEIYLDYVTSDETDYNAPNLNVVTTNNKYMKAFALGFFSHGYVLARLPQGMTVEEYMENDEHAIMTTPGTASTTEYFCLPSEYVLDAVDMWDRDNTEFHGSFLPKDDAQGILGSEAWAGKCIRRKCVKVANGRAYYQDTNNSANDFLTDQPQTPGVHPSVADPE